MGSTYLKLTNAVLTRVGEVNLTSADFAGAVGLPSVAKEAVNNAIRAVNQQEFQWPFNYVTKIQVLTAGTQIYSLPSDYKDVDLDTFFLVRDETLNVEGRHLPPIEYDEWVHNARGNDELIASDPTATTAIPWHVFKTQDDQYGVTPTPTEAYTIDFQYWTFQDDLVASTDVTNIPSRFDSTIVEGALMDIYEFKDNIEFTTKAEAKFDKGVKQMRTLLINKQKYAYAYQITRRRLKSATYPRIF